MLWNQSKKRKLYSYSAARVSERRRSYRPEFDLLEDRLAPAVLHWIGTTNSNWSVATNWLENATPSVVNNQLVFNTTTAGFAGTAAAFAPNNDIGALTGLTLQINDASAAGDFNISGNAFTLAAGGITSTVTVGANATIGNNLTLTAAAALTNTTAAGTLIINGTIANGGFLLTANGGPNDIVLNGVISGGGGLAASGNHVDLGNVNTYGGNTTINVATQLALNTNNAIPNGAGAGNVVDNGGLLLNGINATINGLTGSGAVQDNAVPAVTLSVGGNNATSTFNGTIIDGTGTMNLTKIGTGTLTLVGANTYSGSTTINAGTLQLGANNVIPGGVGKGNVTVIGGATFDLNAFSDTINGLSGAGTVDDVAGVGTSTLTVGGNNQTSTFGGVIQNTTGTVALTKTGTGTLTLSGTDTYTGNTTVNAGTLAVTGSLTSQVNVSGGTLTGTGPVNNVVATSGTVAPGSVGGVGTLTTSAAANSTFNGATLLVDVNGATNDLLNNTNSGSQDVLTGGTLKINTVVVGAGPYTIIRTANANGLSGFFSNAPVDGTIIPDIAGTQFYRVNYTANSVTLTPVAQPNPLHWTGAQSNAWSDPRNWQELSAPVSGDTLVFDPSTTGFNNAFTPNNDLTGLTGLIITINEAASAANDFDLQGNAVSLAGAGISSTDGRTNGVVKEEMQLTLVGGTTFNVVAGGAGSALDVLGKITGTGPVNSTGAGTLEISNTTNDYTGGTNINAGTLQVGDGTTNGVLGNSAGTVTDTTALVFDPATATSMTIANVIQGGGTAAQNGAGTTVLSNIDTYSGGTTVTTGTLDVTGSIASSQVTVNGGTLGGTGTVQNIVLNSGGTVNPGLGGVATLTTSGGANTNFASGTFKVDINGAAPGDELNDTGAGAVMLNRTKNTGVKLRVSTTGVAGGTYTIVDASAGGGYTGQFANARTNGTTVVGTFGGAQFYKLTYNASTITLTPTAAITTLHWTGGGDGTSWSDPDNWLETTTPATGDTLIFDPANFVGGPHFTPNNDIVMPLTGMILQVKGDFDLQGNGITLAAAGITGTAASGGTVTEEMPLALTATTTFSVTGDPVEVTGVISGNAGVVQTAGTGTLIVAGTNTYKGGTMIAAGTTLQVGDGMPGHDGNLGNSAGAVTDGGTLSFDPNTAITIGNAIGGAGVVKQIGPGTTILDAANSYMGGTIISMGKLQVGDGTAGHDGNLGASTGAVTDNAALVVDPNGTITIGNTIDGNGTLTQNGTGTAVFDGHIGNSSPLAGVTTSAGGTTVFGVAGSNAMPSVSTTGVQTYNSAIQLANTTVFFSSGTGGNGTITFTGTVQSPGSAFALTVNTADTTTFGGAVGGGGNPLLSLTTDTGGSTLINGGSIITSGAQTYNDAVDISGGPATTTLTSTTAKIVTCNDNLTLGANTLSVNGDFTLSSNTTLTSTLQSASTYGNIQDTGTATLNSAVLQVNRDPTANFAPDIFQTFTIVSAGTLVPDFSNVPSPGPDTLPFDGILFNVDYPSGTNTVVLTVEPPPEVYIDSSFAGTMIGHSPMTDPLGGALVFSYDAFADFTPDNNLPNPHSAFGNVDPSGNIVVFTSSTAYSGFTFPSSYFGFLKFNRNSLDGMLPTVTIGGKVILNNDGQMDLNAFQPSNTFTSMPPNLPAATNVVFSTDIVAGPTEQFLLIGSDELAGQSVTFGGIVGNRTRTAMQNPLSFLVVSVPTVVFDNNVTTDIATVSSGVVDLTNSTNVELGNSVTIATDAGTAGLAGDVMFNAAGTISATTPGADLMINTSDTLPFSGGGAVTLPTFDNTGGLLVRNVTVNTQGSSSIAGGQVTLNGDIRLTSSQGANANFTVVGGGEIVLNSTVTITTESQQAAGTSAGSVNFGSSDVSASGAGTSLTISTSDTANASSGGALTLGSFDGLAGAPLQNLTLAAQGGPGGVNGSVMVNGSVLINGALLVTAANNVTAASSITAGGITQQAGTGTTTFNGPLDATGSGGIGLTGTNFTINSSITIEASASGDLSITSSGQLTDSGSAIALNGHGLSITDSGSNDAIASAISGSGSTFIKAGLGVLTLNGTQANSFTGLTTVQQGTLQLSKLGVAAIVGSMVIGSYQPGDFATQATATVSLGGANQIQNAVINGALSFVDVTAIGAFNPNGLSDILMNAPTVVTTTTSEAVHGSLQQAIFNALAVPFTFNDGNLSDPRVITFAINGTPQIVLAHALPIIKPTRFVSNPPPVTINGLNASGVNAVVSGAALPAGSVGLVLKAGSTTVKNLAVNSFAGGFGILIQTNNNTISDSSMSGNGLGLMVVGAGNQIARDQIVNNTQGGALVQGNSNAILGTTVSGNGGDGLTVQGNSNAIVGATVSGNNANGSVVQGDSNQLAGDQMLNNIGTGLVLQGSTNVVTGGRMMGNHADGIDIIQGSGNQIGVTVQNNALSGSGNVISGNAAIGLFIAGTGTQVGGNLIGTDAKGQSAMPNGVGILVQGAGTSIGGAATAQRNIVSGNGGDGILIQASAAGGSMIVGNVIGGAISGQDPTGANIIVALANGGDGIDVKGGPAALGMAILTNIIAFNGGAGVEVTDTATSASTTILTNSIFGNGTLSRITGEIVRSGDSPALTAPLVLATTPFSARGTFHGVAGQFYRIEVFASTSLDAHGLPQGQVFIGFVDGLTDGAGNLTWFVNFTGVSGLPFTDVITATATLVDATGKVFGNTTGFSNALQVGALFQFPLPPELPPVVQEFASDTIGLLTNLAAITDIPQPAEVIVFGGSSGLSQDPNSTGEVHGFVFVDKYNTGRPGGEEDLFNDGEFPQEVFLEPLDEFGNGVGDVDAEGHYRGIGPKVRVVNGEFTFTGVKAGTYRLRRVPGGRDDPYEQTTPSYDGTGKGWNGIIVVPPQSGTIDVIVTKQGKSYRVDLGLRDIRLPRPATGTQGALPRGTPHAAPVIRMESLPSDVFSGNPVAPFLSPVERPVENLHTTSEQAATQTAATDRRPLSWTDWLLAGLTGGIVAATAVKKSSTASPRRGAQRRWDGMEELPQR